MGPDATTAGSEPTSDMTSVTTRPLHLKSIRGDLREQVLRDGTSFATAVGQGMFCEPSEGEIDFERLRDVAHRIGYDGFGVVEQDMYPPAPGAPFPIAKRTREYLRDIGLG